MPHQAVHVEAYNMGEEKIGGEFDRPDRLKVAYMPLVERFLSGLQIKPTIKLPTDKELTEALAKAKGKKAQVYANLDGSLLWIDPGGVGLPNASHRRLGTHTRLG